MTQPLSKMNTKQLREIAASLGADKKRLYGTSKQSLLITISLLKYDKALHENKQPET